MSPKDELITVFHLISATLHIIVRTTIDLNPRYQLLYLIISTSVIPIRIPALNWKLKTMPKATNIQGSIFGKNRKRKSDWTKSWWNIWGWVFLWKLFFKGEKSGESVIPVMVGGENELEKDAMLFGSFYNFLSLHGIHCCGFFRALIDDAASANPKSSNTKLNRK